MISPQTESRIDDFIGSQQFLFVDDALKENAEGILHAFFQRAEARGATSLETLTAKTVEAVLLQDMGNLNVPVAVKRGIPDLLEGFFSHVKSSGLFSAAGSWLVCVEALGPRFREGLREDGTLRGQTFRKNYTDVGRNDPCPCGSGKKFKKCCGLLIG